MATQTRGPRHPSPVAARNLKPRPDPILSPITYLEHRRGSDVAHFVVDHARAVVLDLEKPRRPALEKKESRRALMLARELLPYVRRESLTVARFLEFLIRFWEQSTTSKRGRRLEGKALFVQTMLLWGAGELGARGLEQLTATELMAAAVAGGLEEIGNGDKHKMLDSWRKLATVHAPANARALADTVRDLNRLKEENMRLDAELKASKERTKQQHRALSDYFDGRTMGPAR